MDWSGVLGFAIALGVISLVSWSAEKFIGYISFHPRASWRARYRP
jgi:hypothetical protein